MSKTIGMKPATCLRNNQAGMASILITMITMIVVSLIVIGFATISQREQGQTLDQQLSTQAFYAAESAVNDARQVIENAVSAGGAIPPKTSCNSDTPLVNTYPVPVSPATSVVLDASHNVSYTCLLVNPTPYALTHNNVADAAWVVPITSSTSNIAKITIQWTPSTPPATIPSSDCLPSLVLPPISGWNCGYGLLRMDLVPTAGALNNATLASSELTGFFEPQKSAGSGTALHYTNNNGSPNLMAAHCDVGSYSGTGCSASIDQLPASSSFTLRINSLYNSSNVTVTAYDSSGNPISTDAQVLIDATGDANGVLRRIQVTVPINDYTDNTDFALQSNSSICKRFSVTPGYFNIAGALPSLNPDPSNSMCKPANAGTPSPGG